MKVLRVRNTSSKPLLLMLEPLGEYYPIPPGEQVEVQRDPARFFDNRRLDIESVDVGDDGCISLWTAVDAIVLLGEQRVDPVNPTG